jgi:pilus assembly protein CpaB
MQMKPRQMSPRQRQGMLLLVVAIAGLIGVFVLIAQYVSSVSRQVGPKIEVLALRAPLAQYEPINASSLREESVPRKWVPPNVLQSPAQAVGQISKTELPAGELLQQGMLSSPPRVAPGKSEISVVVDPAAGVDYQIQSGETVDVGATFDGNGGTGSGDGSSPQARVVVHDVQVVAVGGGGSGGEPVTLAMTPTQVERVQYAESFGQLRLSLIAPGSTTPPRAPKPYKPSGL